MHRELILIEDFLVVGGKVLRLDQDIEHNNSHPLRRQDGILLVCLQAVNFFDTDAMSPASARFLSVTRSERHGM